LNLLCTSQDEAAKAKHDIKGAAGAGGTAVSSAELTELKKQSAEDKKTLKVECSRVKHVFRHRGQLVVTVGHGDHAEND